MRVKKAAGFPFFYRTPPALVWQGFQPLHSARYRTEHMARTVENPKNRRGFPFYSSGASNPKGSGAQYCSPPNTVIGIETAEFMHERPCYAPIVALQIPSSVLKQLIFCDCHICHSLICSPPNTVIGIFIIILRQIKPFLLSGFIVKLYSKKGFLPLSDMSSHDPLRPAR